MAFTNLHDLEMKLAQADMKKHRGGHHRGHWRSSAEDYCLAHHGVTVHETAICHSRTGD